MDPLSIACPECGSVLRLRDRSKLGKRGKCPKCTHKFVLTAPANAQEIDEVKMELVDTAPAAANAAPQPAVGTSARWIPDEQPVSAHAPQSTSPENGQQAADVAAMPFDVGVPAETDGVSQLQRIKKKSSKGTKIGIAVGAVTALLVTLVVVIAQRSNEPAGKAPPTVNREYEAEKKNLEGGLASAKQKSPTKGDPIELLHVPGGAQIIINLHPAALWEARSKGEEVRACLGGPFNSWAEQTLQEICRFEASEIEQALICLIPGDRSVPPEIAAVVHLKEEQKKSELILSFGAERDDSLGRPVYKNEDYVFNLIDTKTFAVAPNKSAYQQEMVDAMQFPQPTDTDIEELIKYTDRDRHLTVIFEPLDLRNYDKVLVPEQVRTFLNLFVDWFGEDVSTVAWSLHLGEENFHSEMLLRNGQGVSSPRRIYKEFDKKLGTLPHEVLGAVSKMNPEKLGYRKIIGRFPAMVMGYSVGTEGGIGDRYVQLTTVLPERAAPNLAAGLMLTWSESLRTDFTKQAPDLSKPKLPDLLADRLKAKVDVDFRRTPLHEAFAFIAEESKVKFDIDGDALKDKGMTQNMAQNHQLGEIPAIDAIYAIIGQYKDEGMCVVVDETKKIATVMTLKFVDKYQIKESSTVKILRPTGK